MRQYKIIICLIFSALLSIVAHSEVHSQTNVDSSVTSVTTNTPTVSSNNTSVPSATTIPATTSVHAVSNVPATTSALDIKASPTTTTLQNNTALKKEEIKDDSYVGKFWRWLKSYLLAIGKVAFVFLVIAFVIALPLTGSFTLLILWLGGEYSSFSSGWQTTITVVFYFFAIAENLAVISPPHIIGRIVSSIIVFLAKCICGFKVFGPAALVAAIISGLVSLIVIPIVAAIAFYHFLFNGWLRIAWTALS